MLLASIFMKPNQNDKEGEERDELLEGLALLPLNQTLGRRRSNCY
jgi:hypothetical protein